MISLIFIVLASICNAVMDILSHHYTRSIFSKLDREWWNPFYSWKNKYLYGDPDNGRLTIYYLTNIPKWVKRLIGDFNYPVQLTDAWHLFKMLMIIFICLSIITFDKKEVLINSSYNIVTFPIILLVYGLTWNLTFTLFYKHLLRN
jgi:hypothetical protein